MIRLIFLAILITCLSVAAAQTGKYAGSKKKLIGKEYKDSRDFPGLKGWEFREGSLLNPPADPEWIMAEVFRKGSTVLVIISIREDSDSGSYRIADLVEIKGVTKGWTVRTGTCRLHEENNAWIFVWGKESTDEYMRQIKKAWRFNPDKRRVEQVPVKGIDCVNAGC